MHLVNPNAPILRKNCRPDFVVQHHYIKEMFSLLLDRRGLGLAAPQVGIDARFFVTYWGEVFINPRIIEIDEVVESREGCLSLPGVVAIVSRWSKIRLADGREYSGERIDSRR